MKIIDFNSAKTKIERERCNEHNEHPKFNKTVKGFTISACCEDFRTEMIKKAKQVIAEKTKTALTKMIKSSFGCVSELRK